MVENRPLQSKIAIEIKIESKTTIQQPGRNGSREVESRLTGKATVENSHR
jgi:hypothetical protein